MKTKFLLKATFLLSLAFILVNCSKSDDEEIIIPPVVIPEVNPYSQYLITSGFNEKTVNQIDAGNYEFGLSFIPTVSGSVTALVAKIPSTNPALRLTLWNKTTATVLKTETVNYTTSGLEVTVPISPIAVTAGTEYMVTMNSNDWYDRRRNGNTNATYPVTVGDINITGYAYIGGTAQALPNIQQLNYNAGDISFKFQPSVLTIDTPKLTLPASIANNTAVPIPDATGSGCGGSGTLTPGSGQSSINITASGLIADPSKVSIEVDLAHSWGGDVVLELITPGGASCALIKRIGSTTDTSCGSSSDFIAGNKLTFNSAHTILLVSPFTTGNYAQTGPTSGTTIPSEVFLTPLSTFLAGKSIKGEWKLKMYDYGDGDSGTLNSWKLTFATGALQ